ncbi:MAG: polysaccharide biosynthesis/export family protein [Sulfitobacter sp.]
MQIKKSAMMTAFIFSVAGFLLGVPVAADPYRLITGDRIEVAYMGQGRPEGVIVDLDGQVRLPSVGGVEIAGQTLDEAEKLLAAAIHEADLFLDPVVSVSLLAYAPIVVSGDVAQPGRFDFLPGTTIAAALALSGGAQPSGISKFEVERSRIEVEGQLRNLNLEAAATVMEIKRLEAVLGDEPEFVLNAADIGQIPIPNAVPLEDMRAGELLILATDRARATETLAHFEKEIQAIAGQIELFDARIAVQDEILKSVAEDLENARALQERGLQTASRTLAAEQRDADARSRALELESAKVAAVRATGDTQRSRAQFLGNRRDTTLRALQEAKIKLEDLRLRYARQVEESALLGGSSMLALMETETLDFEFDIIRNRTAQPTPRPEDLAFESALLPGDTVIVRIKATNTGEDAAK